MGARESTRNQSVFLTASTNAVKAGPGRILGIHLNPNTVNTYTVTIWDSLTVGAGPQILVLDVASGGGISQGHGYVPVMKTFEVGMSVQLSAAGRVDVVFE